MERRNILRDAGRALYGELWIMPLAHALDVNARTMQRWHSGVALVPAGALAEMKTLLEERRSQIAALLAAIEKAS